MPTLKHAAYDLANSLEGENVGLFLFGLGTTTFVCATLPDDSTPSPVVFFLNTGGPAPQPFLNGGRESFWQAQVQVVVRSAVGDLSDAETLVRGLIGHLHLKPIDGYIGVYVRDAQGVYGGLDPESQRHFISFNVSMHYNA